MSFFERQPEALESPAHGGRRDPQPALVLQKLAVLGEGEVGVALHLGWKNLLQDLPFARKGAGDRPSLHRAGLAAKLKVALDGGDREATSLRGIPRSTAANTLSLRSFEYAFMPAPSHELNTRASRCEKGR